MSLGTAAVVLILCGFVFGYNLGLVGAKPLRWFGRFVLWLIDRIRSRRSR